MKEDQGERLEEVELTQRRKALQKSYLEAQNIMKVNSEELLKAACCNLSESFETNPSIDVNFSDALTGTKQIKMLGLSSPYLIDHRRKYSLCARSIANLWVDLYPWDLD